MAAKTFELDSIGKITVYKRRTNRRISLSVTSLGLVRVSIPTWLPYQAGVNFARSKESWINKTRPAQPMFANNQSVGLSHHLEFVSDPALIKPKSKLSGTRIIVSVPPGLAITDSEVQLSAARGATRALRKQAESDLPKRTRELARYFNLPYNELKIKRLTRRWGSCDREHNLVLNLYLIQLPNDLIDYVICHELTHTKFLNHSADFWSALDQIAPNTKFLKKTLKSYSPGIIFKA